MKKYLSVILLAALVCVLAACGESDINNIVGGQQAAEKGSEVISQGVDAIEGGYNLFGANNWAGMWLDICVLVKRWVPLISVGSFLTGYLIYRLFRKDKEVQKLALTSMMISFPVLCIVFTYAICMIYGLLYGAVLPEGVWVLRPHEGTGRFVVSGAYYLPEIIYNVCRSCQPVVFMLTVGSITLGFFILMVGRSNRELQRMARGSLIIGNTVILVTFGFIYPALYRIFNL